MIEGALITCGVMIAYWIDFGLYFADPNPVAWRFPVCFANLFIWTGAHMTTACFPDFLLHPDHSFRPVTARITPLAHSSWQGRRGSGGHSCIER